MPYTNSILRYPGGKSQLATYVEHLLKINDISKTYVEPFAGGAGVALYLLFHNDVDRIILNDYDPSIFSIWYSILAAFAVATQVVIVAIDATVRAVATIFLANDFIKILPPF